MLVRKLLAVMVILAGSAGSTLGAQAPADSAAACVEDYDAERDYFPVKSEVEYAEGFTIEYFKHYQVVTIRKPYLGATEADGFRYVLVQCGTPAPEGFEGVPVIEVPIESAIVMSTTQLPHFTTLGILDALVGVDGGFYISTPEIAAKYAADGLAEVGYGSEVNAEVAVDTGAEVVFTFASGLPEYDSFPKLEEAGMQTAINAEYAEISPLARAEWIKFTAAFFNKEAEAAAYFGAVAGEYEALAALTAGLTPEERPDVLWNSFSSYIDAWAIPGAETYVGVLLKDAGADVVLADRAPLESVNVSFETAYEAGIEAEVWFPLVYGISTLEGLAASDERYVDFGAFQTGAVYNTDGRVNANGGNDYFENGVNEPQVVLADLIAILHPAVLPEHTLVYLRKME